jgi:hypothetical protein
VRAPLQAPLDKAGFKPLNLPTGPRSRVPQTRPPPQPNNVFETPLHSTPIKDIPAEDTAPVTVLEEETDPEKVLEERRRKREEIMAKFKANGRKPSAVPLTGSEPMASTGTDSVISGGARTGERTGATTGVTTGMSSLHVLYAKYLQDC